MSSVGTAMIQSMLYPSISDIAGGSQQKHDCPMVSRLHSSTTNMRSGRVPLPWRDVIFEVVEGVYSIVPLVVA